MGNPGTFCGRCGAAFGAQDRFCGACGAPRAVTPAVAPPPVSQVPLEAFAPPPRPPVPPPPPAAPVPPRVTPGEERVVGVVPQVVLVKGFLGAKSVFLNLVVTDRRLVFAEQSEELWDQMDALEKQLKADFDDYEGDWRSFVASRDFGAAPWQGLLAQAPDQLIASLGQGFVVPLGEVQSVHVTLRADTDPDFCNSTLLIQGEGQSWDLELPWGNGDEAQRLLSRVVAKVTVEGPGEP